MSLDTKTYWLVYLFQERKQEMIRLVPLPKNLVDPKALTTDLKTKGCQKHGLTA
jgi:hypothetical protein